MNENIYLCYKRTLTSTIAASLIFEKLRNDGYSVNYTRKLRPNDFIRHIDETLCHAEDAIVLLDERSLMALDEGEDRFLESWFARELIACARKKMNIIVICLNGFSLPDKSKLPNETLFLYDAEMKAFDTFNFNVSDDIENIVGELKSRPVLKYMHEKRTAYENSADFLFYSEDDCSIYEYGYLVATLDANVDKHHPFKYTVNRSGQHYFYIINNETAQTQEISFEINPGFQKYVHIQWEKAVSLANLKDDDVKKEKDSNVLYDWGKSFFFGSLKYRPNYHMALQCFLRSAELGNQKAIEFIRKYDHSLASIYKVPQEVADCWYKQAAEYGSPEAWMKMGEQKEAQSEFSQAIEFYQHALKLDHIQAKTAIERCENYVSEMPKQNDQNVFLNDFHNIIINFRRQVGTEKIGKYKRLVDFASIVNKLVKMEERLRDSTYSRTFAVFISDSKQSKYYNRMFALIGYLAQKDVFDNLSHKDILKISLDEQGENQSDTKDFKLRMGGDKNIKESNIAKMTDRIISDRVKASLDKATLGLFV